MIIKKSKIKRKKIKKVKNKAKIYKYIIYILKYNS